MKFTRIVFLFMLICSCSTTSNYYTFDNALEIGTKKIQNDLLAGTEVAILDFKSDNENLSAYVIEEMYDKLINFGKLSIMERSRTNTIAMEVGYQFSGEVNDSEIINIGHQLGADYVVTGQIVFSGEAYRLRVFAIDIEKGRRVASSSLNINPNDKQINYLISTKITTQQSTVPSTRLGYNIGDTGTANEYPPENGIYGIDPADIIPEIGLVPAPERQFDERTQLEYEVVGGRSVTITQYNGNATTLNIPAQIQRLPVTAISNLVFAFFNYKSLTGVTIPSSVTSIEDYTFRGSSEGISLPSLTSITVDNRNPSYASIDGVLFDKNIRTIIKYPQGKKGTYVIPSSVTSIGYYAFSDCISLASVTIPSSVMTIEYGAFEGCRSLTSVTIPSSVTSIGRGAFWGCRSLTSVTIPSSVTSIGDGAFMYCESLTSVTIPSSITSIGKNAFYNCSSLTSVTLSRRTRVGENAFPETARIIYRD